MADYHKSCALEIKDLNMNEAEVALLKAEIEKKSDALGKIKDLDKKIAESDDKKEIAASRKLRAEQNKILNDVKNEIKSDYQRYAKDEAIGNISTLRRRALSDNLVKGTIKGKDIFVNREGATKNNIFANLQVSKQEFKSYINSYDKLEELKDPDIDISDYNNPHVKDVVKHLRTYMDQNNLETIGKKYFNSDLEHVVHIDRDSLHADTDRFIDDIKAHTDNEKLLDSFKRVKDGVKGFDEANEESAVGATRERLRDETLDSALEKWKSDIHRGITPRISLSKLPFKTDDDFNEFSKKWSKVDPVTNYMSFINNRYLGQHVDNKLFGGRIHIESLPPETFEHITKAEASANYDLFHNSHEMSSQRQMKYIKAVRVWKSVTMASKAVMLPIWSLADTGSVRAIEELKNNQFNFYRSYGKYFTGLVTNLGKDVASTARNVKGLAAPMLRIAEKKQLGKLYEALNSYSEYQSVRVIEEMGVQHDNKIMAILDRFNKKFSYDPMHNVDANLRNGVWHANIETLRHYDPSKPVGMTERLQKLGITDDDVRIIQGYINDGTLKEGVIEDVDNSAIRKKLRLLKYDGDLSSVPVDVTPYRMFTVHNKAWRDFVGFFWSYHLKSTSQVLSIINKNKGLMNKVGAAGLYALYGLPTNLMINSIFTYLYTGENPFSSKRITSTIFESLVGQVSKPAMILTALLSGDNNKLGAQLSNPLIGQASAIYHGISAAIPLTAHSRYMSDKDKQKDWNKIISLISKVTPFGTIGSMGYRAANR